MRVLTVALMTLLTSCLFLTKAIAQNEIDAELAAGKVEAVEAVKYDCSGVSFYGIQKKLNNLSGQVEAAGNNGDASFHCLEQIEQDFNLKFSQKLEQCRAQNWSEEIATKEYQILASDLAQSTSSCLNQPPQMSTQE